MRRVISLLATPAVILAIYGCASSPSTDTADATDAATTASDAELADIAARAAELQDALNRHEGDIRTQAATVRWVEPVAIGPTPTQQRFGETLVRPTTARDAQASQPERDKPARDTQADADAAKPRAAAPIADREQLIAALLRDLRTSDDPAMARALRAAMVSVIEPGVELTAADIAGLSADQRDAVQRFRLLLIGVSAELVKGDSQVDHELVRRQLDRVIARQPIWIRDVQLCTSVSSYGVYETFPTRRFVAGRAQPMVVYVELDHFQPQQQPDGQYTVQLRRELELYTESDGLVVWREPAQDVVDQSRNRRHDFFLAQLIELPANINVGKYLLKVRIVDLADGTRDERTVPIEYVADATLVNRARVKP